MIKNCDSNIVDFGSDARQCEPTAGINIEQAILGALITSASKLSDIPNFLKEEHFEYQDHKKIFVELHEHIATHGMIEPLALERCIAEEERSQSSTINDAGRILAGAGYVRDLISASRMTPMTVEDCAHFLRGKWARRQAGKLARDEDSLRRAKAISHCFAASRGR